MKYKKSSAIGGIIIATYLLIGIYGLNLFEMYDNNSLIDTLSIYMLLLGGVFSITYSFITILNEKNYKKVSTYFVGILFSLIVANFIFWGTLGSILLLNDLLNDNSETEIIGGVLIRVDKIGDKGEHYEALVLIGSDTSKFAINKEKFESFQDEKMFYEFMRKGYFGILYK